MRFLNLIKQDFKNLITNKPILVFCTVFPITLVLLFGFLFSSIYGSNVTSYDYYGVTMMLYMIIYCVTMTPNTFMEARIKQANLRIAYSPISRVEIYLSKLLSTYIFMAIAFIFDILLFHFLGIVNYGNDKLIYILILNLSLLMFSITLGGAACVVIRSEETTNKILSLVLNIVSIFSGIFFQIDSLGKWAAKVSNLSPLKWVLDTSFKVIYDNSFNGYLMTILSLIGLSLVCTLIVHFKYRQEDYI